MGVKHLFSFITEYMSLFNAGTIDFAICKSHTENSYSVQNRDFPFPECLIEVSKHTFVLNDRLQILSVSEIRFP